MSGVGRPKKREGEGEEKVQGIVSPGPQAPMRGLTSAWQGAIRFPETRVSQGLWGRGSLDRTIVDHCISVQV